MINIDGIINIDLLVNGVSIKFTENELKALSKYLNRCKNDQHIGLTPDGCRALIKVEKALFDINNLKEDK